MPPNARTPRCGSISTIPARPAPACASEAFPGEDPETLPPPEAHAESLIQLALPSCTMNGEWVAGDAALSVDPTAYYARNPWDNRPPAGLTTGNGPGLRRLNHGQIFAGHCP